MPRVSDELLMRIHALPTEEKRKAISQLNNDERRRLIVMLDPDAAESQKRIDRLATVESPETSAGETLTPGPIARGTTPSFDKLIEAKEDLVRRGIPEGMGFDLVAAQFKLGKEGTDLLKAKGAALVLDRANKISTGLGKSAKALGRLTPGVSRFIDPVSESEGASGLSSGQTFAGPTGKHERETAQPNPEAVDRVGLVQQAVHEIFGTRRGAVGEKDFPFSPSKEGADAIVEKADKVATFGAMALSQAGTGGPQIDAVTSVGAAALEGLTATGTEFVVDPGEQAANRPGEAALNVGEIATLGASRALRAGRVAKTAAKAMRTKADNVAKAVRNAKQGERVAQSDARVARAASMKRGEVISRLSMVEGITPSKVRRIGNAHRTKSDPHGTAFLRRRLVEAERNSRLQQGIEDLVSVKTSPSPGHVSETALNAALEEADTARKAAHALRVSGADDAADAANATAKAIEDGVEAAGETAAEAALKKVQKVPAKERAAAKRAEALERRTDTKSVLQKRSLEAAGEVNAAEAAEAGANMQRGAIHEDMLTRMGTSAIGATISQVALADEDGLSLSGFFMGALGGFLVGAKGFLRGVSPTGGRFSATENIIDAPMFLKLFPDKNVESKLAREIFARNTELTGMAAGATIGGLAGGGSEEREFSPLGAVAGAVGGAVLTKTGFRVPRGGSVSGRPFNPRRMVEKALVVDGDVPKLFRPMKVELKRKTAGRLSQVGDALRVLDKGTEAEKSLVMQYLNNSIGVEAIPDRLRFAAGMERLLFDDIAQDFIKYGAISGELAAKLKSGLGVYLPRIYIALDQNNQLLRIARYSERVGENPDDLIRAVQALIAHKADQKKLMATFRKAQKEAGVSTRRRGGKQFTAEYFKRLDESIPKEIREAIGEIDVENPNPAYLLGRRGPMMIADLENLEFANYVASSPDNLVEAMDVKRTIKALEDTGEFADVKHTRRDGTQITTKLEHKPEPDGFGGEVGIVIRDGERFRQLPDSNRYGVLKGEYVQEDMAHFFLDQQSTPKNWIRRGIDAGTGLFKASKVPWNPGTLFRNIYGQIPLNDMGGVAPWEVNKYKTAFVEYVTQGKKTGRIVPAPGKGGQVTLVTESGGYLEAQKSGLFGGEYFGAEVKELLDGGTFMVGGERVSALDAMTSGWSKISKKFVEAERLAGKLGEQTIDRMRRFHEGSDQFNKLVMYRHARLDLGLSAEKSVEYALRWVFNYQDVPQIIQTVRKSPIGAPFISFTYKALPRVMETAAAVQDPRRSVRFWRWPATFAAMNEAAHRVHGKLKDDEKGVGDTIARIAKNTLNYAVGGRTVGFTEHTPEFSGHQQLLTFFKDDMDQPTARDLTYYLPWGAVGELGQGGPAELLKEMGYDAFPQALTPSGPWVNMAAAAWTGIDPFTGKKITSRNNSTGDNRFAMAKFVAQQFSPQAFRDSSRVLDALAGGNVDDPGAETLGQSLSRFTGGRTKSVDPRKNISFKITEITHRLNELEREIKKVNAKPRRSDAKVAQLERLKLQLRDEKRALQEEKRTFERNEKLEAAEKAKRRSDTQRRKAPRDAARALHTQGDN